MHVKHHLCDDNDSQHVAFVEGQVVFGCAFKVVPGHTLCALWPRGLWEQINKPSS